MLLPLDIVSEEPELYHTLERLSSRLLGQDIDEYKINCIFSKLSQHILPIGIEQSGDTLSYRQPSDESYETLMRRSEAHHVPARVLHEIYKFCPNFQLKYPDARTWKDIKYCSGAFTINGVFSLDWLKAQYLYARINLGLPFGEVLTRAWNTDHLKDIRARVRSGNVELLENAYDLQLPFKYCILVRALPKPSPIGAIATMAGENIMTFYPIFFEGYDGMLEDSLRDFLIIPFETDIRGFTGGRVQIVLHELFHSPSVLNASDFEAKYTEEEYNDLIREPYICSEVVEQFQRDTSPDECNLVEKDEDVRTVKLRRIPAYGLRACIDLPSQGNHVHINMAEDNAESWSLLCVFRVLMFAYPDLDFQAAYDEDYTPTWDEWKIYPRSTLLHHCTLFEYLRHPDMKPYRSITEHPDYDAQKDAWAAHTGRKRPKSGKELLRVVDGIVKQRLKEEDEKIHRARERQKLKDRGWSDKWCWMS